MLAISLDNLLTAFYIFGGSVVVALIVHFVLKKVLSSLAHKTGTTLDNEILEALEKPSFAAVIFLGLYLALKSLPFQEITFRIITIVVHSIFVAVLIYAIYTTIRNVLKWYSVEIASRTKTSLDDKIINLLSKAAIFIAFFVGIIWILDIVGIDLPWLKSWLIRHGIRMGLITIFSMALIFILGRLIPAAVKPAILRKAKDQSEEETKKRVDTLSGVFVSASEVLIILMASFMILSELGINIAPLLAGAGVVGLAVGFGAQSLIKDILNGLFITLENQYRIGDMVKIADMFGLVEDMNLRRTVLRDLDGVVHCVPNGEIKVSSNFTRDWSRVNLNISVAYGEDLDRVIAVINRVGKELATDPAWAQVILKPPQVLRVDNLGDSGIDIKILGDTKPTKQWDIMSELRIRLKKAFDKEGIEIPWPHTKVYFGNSPLTGDFSVDKQEPNK